MGTASVKHKQEAKRHIIIGAILVLVGLVGFILPFMSYTVAQPSDVGLVGLPAESPQADTSPGVPTPTPDPNLPDIADRLLIPELGISMPLLTGDQDKALNRGAWLMGSRPGLEGNSVIFGHRFKYLPPLSNTMFRLDSLDYGDMFTVRWQGEDRVYVVREKRIIEPTEVSVAANQGDERVTLITCTPVWSTSHRLIIVGFPVDR